MEEINAPTRSMEITAAAVEAALDVVMDDGHNGIECRPDRNLAVTVRAALEAALPYLTPADGGLREALEKLCDERASSSGAVASDYYIQPYELRDVLADHPAVPANGRPVIPPNEDDRCSYCGSTGWNGINAHYCDHCDAGPTLAAYEAT